MSSPPQQCVVATSTVSFARVYTSQHVYTQTHICKEARARTHTRANKLEKKYLSLTLKLEPFSIRSAQTHTSTPSPHISCSSINLNHMRKSNPPTATKHTQTRVFGGNESCHTSTLPFISQKIFKRKSQRLVRMASHCEGRK